jgi:hypothetical protein
MKAYRNVVHSTAPKSVEVLRNPICNLEVLCESRLAELNVRARPLGHVLNVSISPASAVATLIRARNAIDVVAGAAHDLKAGNTKALLGNA